MLPMVWFMGESRLLLGAKSSVYIFGLEPYVPRLLEYDGSSRWELGWTNQSSKIHICNSSTNILISFFFEIVRAISALVGQT